MDKAKDDELKEVWMPHPAHFICSRDCKFVMATAIGGVVVSTVGEYWPDREVRKIHADVRGVRFDGKGDNWDAQFFEKFGFIEIGYKRKYETMVFLSRPATEEEGLCCPFRIRSGLDLDGDTYNESVDAYRGHLALIAKWREKQISGGVRYLEALLKDHAEKEKEIEKIREEFRL